MSKISSLETKEYFQTANQLKRKGSLAEAIIRYQKLIDLDPNFAWYHYNLAETLAKQGNLQEAISECQRAIDLKPGSIWFHAVKAKKIYEKLCLTYSVSLPFFGFEDILFKESHDKSNMMVSTKKVFNANPQLLEPNLSRQQISKLERNIIVAGIPRSGTTMVFRALAGLPPRDTTPRNYPDSASIKKTHGIAPKQLPEGYKAIFVFGDIVSSVISTKKHRYDKTHFINCGCSKDPEHTDIYLEDALHYEAMFDTWNRNNGYPVICVRYEKIHENLKKINDFLGVNLHLPPRKSRSTKYSDCTKEELENIQQTYASLIQKVNNAPDVAIYH